MRILIAYSVTGSCYKWDVGKLLKLLLLLCLIFIQNVSGRALALINIHMGDLLAFVIAGVPNSFLENVWLIGFHITNQRTLKKLNDLNSRKIVYFHFENKFINFSAIWWIQNFTRDFLCFSSLASLKLMIFLTIFKAECSLPSILSIHWRKHATKMGLFLMTIPYKGKLNEIFASSYKLENFSRWFPDNFASLFLIGMLLFCCFFNIQFIDWTTKWTFENFLQMICINRYNRRHSIPKTIDIGDMIANKNEKRN